jgi:hypothetical protein
MKFTDADIQVGGRYPFELAPGLVSVATVIGRREIGGMPFVRYSIPTTPLPGFCRASVFAKAVRHAMKGD